MFTNRVLVVCGVLAVACAVSRGDDKPMVPPTRPPAYDPRPEGAIPAKSPDPVLKVVVLKHRKAEELAETLRAFVGNRVRVLALPAQNLLLLLGPPDAVALAVLVAEENDQLPLHVTPRLILPVLRKAVPGVDPHMVLPKKVD